MEKLIYDPELYNQVKGSLNRVDTMLQDLQAGKGSAGKLLNDPALYNETQKTIDDLHTLVKQPERGQRHSRQAADPATNCINRSW